MVSGVDRIRLFCKLIGSLMIIAGFSGGGIKMVVLKKRHVSQCGDMIRIIEKLYSFIGYLKKSLPEAFFDIAKAEDNEIAEWLSGLALGIQENESDSFAKIWENELKRFNAACSMDKDLYQEMQGLGKYLGSYDIRQQLAGIELVKKNIIMIEEEKRRSFKNFRKAIMALFVSAGVMVVILLI